MKSNKGLNPVKTSKTTPLQEWSPEQVAQGNSCCSVCNTIGLSLSVIAILIQGEDILDMEYVRPGTVELFHRLMLDKVTLDESTDETNRKLLKMMVEESYLLFTHALDEDIKAWNR